MKAGVRIVAVALLLWGCAEPAPNLYPENARAEFHANCPADEPACPCTWDKITRALTYEEYEAVLARFDETGSMDTRITRARTQCLERHDE